MHQCGLDKGTSGAADLDGNPRVVVGTVDIGAYEFQSPSSPISYAWLQRFGLSVNGSDAYQDPDHDGFNSWQEWIAGTNPTNAASTLVVDLTLITNEEVSLSWPSVAGRSYTVEYSTNLMGGAAFALAQSNIMGNSGQRSWVDTNAMNSPVRLYRIRVQRSP